MGASQSDNITRTSRRKNQAEGILDVAIIGSGFSGIGMGAELKKRGINDFRIFEKAASAGGTWRDNSYPGCACDVESALYSFSFAQNPSWSRGFAPQAEIQQYLEKVLHDVNLDEHMCYGHALSGARFDAQEKIWQLKFSNGQRVQARKLVSAIGALHLPNIPDIRGLNDFKGEVFHSAQWRHDVDLTGKRVAVIGTGASAIQFVPAITQQVKSLTLFQRSAAWVLPKPDRAISKLEQGLYETVPPLMSLRRAATYSRLEGRALAFNYFTSALKVVEAQAVRHIKKYLKDPVKVQKLTPDYHMGCKRVLISNDYYAAINREHVALETCGIERVNGNAIIDSNGVSHEVDVIILGTGFKTLDAVAALDIRNADGQTLAESWENGAQSHLGCMLSGFPNFFLLLGPNTGLGHNSQVYMIESQIRYIGDALSKMRQHSLASVEVKESVQAKFVRQIQSRLKNTIWQSGCQSWYINDKGENWTLWPGFTFVYRYLSREFKLGNHHCVPRKVEKEAAVLDVVEGELI